LQTLRLLGRGGFGAVSACRKVNTGALYAMKVIYKVRNGGSGGAC
jgi:hypothetical protein